MSGKDDATKTYAISFPVTVKEASRTGWEEVPGKETPKTFTMFVEASSPGHAVEILAGALDEAGHRWCERHGKSGVIINMEKR